MLGVKQRFDSGCQCHGGVVIKHSSQHNEMAHDSCNTFIILQVPVMCLAGSGYKHYRLGVDYRLDVINLPYGIMTTSSPSHRI